MAEALDLLLTRRSVPPALLKEPGPDKQALHTILTAACRVPDHGKLTPWHVLLFRGITRQKFGEILANAHAAANPDATQEQLAFERARFLRAPLVACVVSSPRPNPKIPEWEQRLSAAAVCFNMLHAASALGFAACWLTEWYAYDETVRAALGLAPGERVAGFVYIGSAASAPPDRPRPAVEDVARDWAPPGG